VSRHDDLLALVDQVYRAATDSDQWAHVWGRLCALTGSSSAGILSTSLSFSSQAVFAGMTNAEATALYNAHYGKLDPWFAASKRVGLSTGPQTFVGDQLVGRSALTRTEFYNDFGRPFDIVRPVTIVHRRTSTDVFALTVVRSDKGDEWSSEDAFFVRALEPHVRRALEVHSRLEAASGRSDATEGAVDSLTVGVICLDAGGNAVFVNTRARRIANARDGFGFDGRKPTTAAVASRAALQSRLAVALTGHAALRQVPPGPLLVPRPSGRAAYRVDITPTPRRSDCGDERSSNGAILFITDPTDQSAASVPRIMALFGLTASEAAVAAAVGAGQSLECIAAARGVRVQTVRTQLKQIFGKTGTNRQSALAALIERTVSPVNGR
jgi:DNA-binding CsgD family transcriptional regulator